MTRLSQLTVLTWVVLLFPPWLLALLVHTLSCTTSNHTVSRSNLLIQQKTILLNWLTKGLDKRGAKVRQGEGRCCWKQPLLVGSCSTPWLKFAQTKDDVAGGHRRSTDSKWNGKSVSLERVESKKRQQRAPGIGGTARRAMWESNRTSCQCIREAPGSPGTRGNGVQENKVWAVLSSPTLGGHFMV